VSTLARSPDVPARPLAPWPGGLLAALLLTCAASAVFYYRQNFAGQVGGPISMEKSLWLNYTMTAWFVVPAFLAWHGALDRSLRHVLGWFLASMAVRGVAELWLIYVTFGWSPIYGISHDVFNIALIAVLRRRARGDLVGLDGFNLAVRRFCTSLQGSLVAEIVFAALFYRMGVHQDAVYFAPPTEAFAHINLLTRCVDIVVYGDLAWFLWSQRRPLFGRPASMIGAHLP
jgi:hypothetical protein